MTFNLNMMPASEGDALHLCWGSDSALFHALIDLGRTRDYKLQRSKYREIGHFELLVITHIDADHIEGAMPLVKENSAPFTVGDVWFNAWHHLRNAKLRSEGAVNFETLSAKQGEKLSEGILKFSWPWNAAFGLEGIASVNSLIAKSPLSLNGGLQVTLLSPSDSELIALEPVWMRELKRAHLRPHDPDEAEPEPDLSLESLARLNVDALAMAPFVEDDSEPNGASIAFLAQFDSKTILLGADAHPNVIEAQIRKLGFSEARPMKLDLFKLCHHGSKFNLSPTLLKLIDCTKFAISTDGSRHGHPDREAIARLLMNDRKRHKTLYFNTHQAHSELWADEKLQTQYNYRCVIPDTPGISIEL